MSRAENESFSFGSPSCGWPTFCDCGRKLNPISLALRRDICNHCLIEFAMKTIEEDNGTSNED